MKHFIYTCFLVLLVTSFIAAQTPQARVVTESVSPHGLTTMGLTTNSVSPGLPVFANQSYVYLSAKEVSENEPVLTSVFNLIQKPGGSVATLEDVGIANWKGLKADIKGAYTIEITITTATGTDMDTATVYAGDYVGVGTFDGVPGAFPSCMTCHTGQTKFDDIYGRWQVSGHANIFNYEIDNGAAYYSTSCMKCHTTGYDHNVVAANNGFDDVAASLGWVWAGPPAPGNWAALKSTYPGLVKFATIGCENCHGAGSNHPATQLGADFTTLATYRAGSCAQCHDEPWRHNKYSEFENSVHSESVFETTTGSNANTYNLGDCARCHDGRVYIQFTKGILQGDPSKIDVKTLTEATATRVTCQTCHDPHGNSNVASLRSTPTGSDTLANGYQYTAVGGLGQVCMNCHKARRNNVTYMTSTITRTWGPHSSVQADNFLGKNAAEFTSPYLTNSHQFAVTDACVTCHMVATADTGTVNRDKVGGHSFRLNNPENGYEHTTACTNCHGPITSFDDFVAPTDYDGDGSVESIRGEVDGLLYKLAVLLPPTDSDSISWEMIRDMNDLTVKKAYWNYQLINNDGSKGMHNSKFTFDVLVKTLSALGSVIPVELVSFEAQVGNNGVTLKWETASELNNRGFEIERSFKGKWATVGFVEGKGTTTEYTRYTFTDKPNTSNAVSYRLKQLDFNGQYSYSKVVNVDFGTMPTEFSLSQNYPNPFNPSTMIKFALPFDSKVKVTIYSITGEVVQVLIDGEYTAGIHEAQFSSSSANGLSSGIYLYSISAVSNDGKSTFAQTKKMVLIK